MNEKSGRDTDERGLDSDIEAYLNDKERIRKIVGEVGGVPRKKERIINIVFIALVTVAFTLALIKGDIRNIYLEIAILLVSFKLVYVVSQNMKITHFQFWMLSTLEWRLNEITKDIRELKKKYDADRPS